MKNKSPLNALLNYANDQGMDRLYRDFKSGLNDDHRDHSKEYSEEEKVIYFFPAMYDEDNNPFGYDHQAESLPRSFDDHVNNKISRVYNAYLNWLEELFETESAEKTNAIIKDHKTKIDNLFNKIDENETLPRKALRLIQKKLREKESRFYSDNSDSSAVDNEIDKITTRGIYQRYHELFDGGNGMKAKSAYNKIENWLLTEMDLSREEVKEKWNVTLDVDTFTRSARNNRS